MIARIKMWMYVFFMERIGTTMREEAENLYRVKPGDRYFP